MNGRAPQTVLTRVVRPIIAIIAILLVVVSTFAWSKIDTLKDNTANAFLSLGGEADGATDILLVGSDSRTDAKGNPLTPSEQRMLHAGSDVESTNTDTILLVRIPHNGRSATAISIPRDTWISTPKLGEGKINGVYGQTLLLAKQEALAKGMSPQQAEKVATDAGREALLHAVADLTGVTVDHYAEVGLLGFVLITNAVGGVEVCLNRAVNDPYSGAHFRAGVQTLSGSKALAFVRQRHGLLRGDLDRITRQQAYMASMVRKVLSAGVLTNPDALNRLTQAINRSVVVNEGWDVVQFAQQLQHLTGGQVKFATIPVTNPDAHMKLNNGDMVSAIEVDPPAVKAWVERTIGSSKKPGKKKELPKLERVNIDRSAVSLSVLNAGSLAGLAGSVAKYLEGLGYQTQNTGNSDNDTPTSVVVGNPQTMAAADAVSKDLGGLPVQSSADVPIGTVRVVLSDDYEGPATKDGKTVFASDLELPVKPTVSPGSTPSISAGGRGPQCVN